MSMNTSWTANSVGLSFEPTRLAELTLSLTRAMQLASTHPGAPLMSEDLSNLFDLLETFLSVSQEGAK